MSYLRTQAAAEHLNVSKSLLEKYRGRGDGPLYYKLGKLAMYRASDLDEWAAQRARRSTSAPDHGAAA